MNSKPDKTDAAPADTPFPTRQNNPEKRLDDALGGTFPASDPVQIARRPAQRIKQRPAQPASGREHSDSDKQERLDEALEETFPASDPVSITTRKTGKP